MRDVTRLGTITIDSGASVVDARGKLRAVALLLDYGPVIATRLATALSAAGRTIGRHQSKGTVELSFLLEPEPRLFLEIKASVADALRRDLQPFFDTVTPIKIDGQCVAVRAEELHPDPTWRPSSVTIASVQERLRQLSREQLMDELRAQNEELEHHRRNLEQIVAKRTEELNAAMEAARAASQAKGEFLSNMSHELRTPLNGVLGYTQILQRDGTITRQQRECLDSIASCGKHLLTLINDVLDLSKIEAGRMEIHPAPCDLHKLIESVRSIVAQRAQGKGLEFVVTVASELPRAVEADETKLKQILVNLLGNAVKFTDRGSVFLEVTLELDERLRFDVRDTGIGMTPEELADVFDPFKQAEGGKISGGTGLGLSISQRLVEAMGGTIGVTSERGAGTCFTVFHPLVPVEENEIATGAESLSGGGDVVLAPGRTVRVLVVDDVLANRDVLRLLLAAAGFETDLAVDGIDALEKVRARPYDVVLMDVRMPRMSGEEAARAIRDDEALRDLTVIAVSASVFPDFQDRAQEAGFDDFISKPVRTGELFSKLRQHLDLTYVDAESVGTGGTNAEPASVSLANLPEDLRAAVTQRLTAALAQKNITSLKAVASDLAARDESRALGEEIGALVRAFNFAGLEALVRELAPTL